MALAQELDAHAAALSKCYDSATRRDRPAGQTARKQQAANSADAPPNRVSRRLERLARNKMPDEAKKPKPTNRKGNSR